MNTYAQSAALMTKNKQDIGADLGLNVAASIFELGCFAFVALAFGMHDIEAMICGYVVVTLFAMISFVPQGVGVVEAAALVTSALFAYRSGNRHGGDHGLSRDRFLAALPDRRCGHPTEQAALRTWEEHEERIVGRKERADKTCFLRTAAEQLDCSSYSIKFVDSTVRTYHCMNFSRGFLRAYPRSAAGTKKSASSPIAIQKSFW